MQWQKSFDELLAQILADYANQFPGADLSPGSLIFIKSACTASALWGLYRHQDWVARQIMPQTADERYLELHALRRQIIRKPGESAPALLARLEAAERTPFAGGKKTDYELWALAVENVTAAWCLPLRRGTGTVDVLILADEAATGSEIPTQALLDAVLSAIEQLRPVGMAAVDPVAVIGPSLVITEVEATVIGPVDLVQLAADIAAYMRTLIPGEPFYPAQVVSLAIANGASSITVTAPPSPVVPSLTGLIRPGVINVA